MKHAWLVLLLCVAFSPRATAAPDATPPPEAVSEARHHFLAGSKAYNAGEYTRAIDEYKAAYNALPDPSFLYNIAQANRLSGNLTEALFFYRSYLRNVTGTSNRREVEGHITQIEAQLQRQKAITTAPPVTTQPDPTPVTQPTTTQPDTTVATANNAVQPPDEGKPKPAYKKGWVWGVVVASVVVVGVGLGVGLGIGLDQQHAPSTDLGNQKVFGAQIHNQLSFSFGGGAR